MDIDNMTIDELREALKKELIYCKKDFTYEYRKWDFDLKAYIPKTIQFKAGQYYSYHFSDYSYVYSDGGYIDLNCMSMDGDDPYEYFDLDNK